MMINENDDPTIDNIETIDHDDSKALSPPDDPFVIATDDPTVDMMIRNDEDLVDEDYTTKEPTSSEQVKVDVPKDLITEQTVTLEKSIPEAIDDDPTIADAVESIRGETGDTSVQEQMSSVVDSEDRTLDSYHKESEKQEVSFKVLHLTLF